jgi:glycosyltransferase involved in cell wall biosynthesis
MKTAVADDCEVTILMPCLNEEATVERCVRKASNWMASRDLRGEIIVADNGSTDRSRELAAAAGARLVRVKAKGYGAALRGGFAEARGRWIIMGDADDSYDFSRLDAFVDSWKQGDGLILGCRLPTGGGTVLPGAMPWLHRWLGNPLFSLLARWFFGIPIHDIYCGLRAIDRRSYACLSLRCEGMEFAIEMVLRAAQVAVSIREVPITLHPDGRGGRPPHLATWRDGWRTLRFFILFGPWKFLFIPGFAVFFAGWILVGSMLAGLSAPDFRAAIATAFLVLAGWQMLVGSVMIHAFAIREGFLPMTPHIQQFYQWCSLEVGILLGLTMQAIALALTFQSWEDTGLAWLVPTILGAGGFQLFFASLAGSIFGLTRAEHSGTSRPE